MSNFTRDWRAKKPAEQVKKDVGDVQAWVALHCEIKTGEVRTANDWRGRRMEAMRRKNEEGGTIAMKV